MDSPLLLYITYKVSNILAMADFVNYMNNTAHTNDYALAENGLHVVSAASFRMDRTEPSGILSRRVWTLEIFTSGQLSISIAETNWRTLGQNQGVLYSPDTPYREKNADRTACESICLLFEVAQSSDPGGWTQRMNPYRIVEDPQTLLAPLIDQVLRYHHLAGPDALLARGAFLQVMGYLFRAGLRDDHLLITENPLHGDLLTRAHGFMRANLHKPISLPDFAEHLQMTESGFSHAYKRLAGISPMLKLRQLRIQAAKSHIATGQYSLARIARLTGFADAFHLSRTFKKITGQSPSNFRKKINGDAVSGIIS
ncbi:MAG: helix-turn-helix transcriptional regulator [Phycisphaerales bacterium]|jgi:AraC-like DNA-binding protein|nr:helix-turn-helix transcriptional regulator [Phycisphaerales bacterium]